MTLLDSLNWRYAVKAYDPTKKVAQEDIAKIIEAIRLTPTSSGLQQFRLLVIQDQAVKEKLTEGSFNPDCMRDCSHVLVLAAKAAYQPEYIDEMFAYTAKVRNLPAERFAEYSNRLKSHYGAQSQQAQFEHCARQAYIGLGLALAQAAELKIDSTPAEGFNSELVDHVLDLKSKGLKSCLLVYLGYSDPARDWMRPMAKVRVPVTEFVEFI